MRVVIPFLLELLGLAVLIGGVVLGVYLAGTL